jgi:nucleotide-binding universal stress UspA family protein
MRIGIAVDGSSGSRAATEIVAALSLSGLAHVSVIGVAEPPVVLAPLPFGHLPVIAGLIEQLGETAEARARLVAEHAAERLAGLPCPVTVMVLRGHPVETLIRVAAEEDLDLLVVGPRGLGDIGSVLLGSVSQALLHAMPTSILVARAPTRGLRRVIMAVDGSPQSLAAAEFLSRFPLPSGVEVHVLVSVTSWTPEYRDLEAPDLQTLLAAERGHAREIADRAAALLERQGRRCTTLIGDGDPKREILHAALELDADLIVTGARGLGGFEGLVLGSVSRAISKAAPCSVLVVGGRPPAGQDPDA